MTAKLVLTSPPVTPAIWRWARFDGARVYRYELGREWGKGPTLAFFGVNPSDANEQDDDPTTRVLMARARREGFGRLLIGNPFALVSSDPSALRAHPDPIGPDNDNQLASIIVRADTILCGWGDPGAGERAAQLLAQFQAAGKTALALGLTKAGNPWHPLRKSAALPMRPLTELLTERSAA